MKRTHSRLAVLQRWKVGRWMLCATALLSFAAGSLVTARLTHLRQVRADSNRVFELMVYHTEPGKVPELESIFRDVSKLQAKHDLNVIGYWVPNDDPAWANTFIYLVAHPSQEEAKKNWAALHADPAPGRESLEDESCHPRIAVVRERCFGLWSADRRGTPKKVYTCRTSPSRATS
jgi:NIPSNAP